jgi:hypothetical protein
MGVYTDLLTSAASWHSGTNGSGVSEMTRRDAVITDEIKAYKVLQSDPAAGIAFNVRDEVQSISTFNGAASSGNFTLTIDLAGESAFTTGNIVWNASAATIETAIDVAATEAAVTDWVNGDISVALTTNLNDANASVTFDGNSVDETRHSLIVMNDVDLDANVSTVSVTVYGQTNRTVWAVIDRMGLLTGGPPPTGEATGLTATTDPLLNIRYPSYQTLQALAIQAAIEDGNDDIYQDLMDLFRQRHAV